MQTEEETVTLASGEGIVGFSRNRAKRTVKPKVQLHGERQNSETQNTKSFSISDHNHDSSNNPNLVSSIFSPIH